MPVFLSALLSSSITLVLARLVISSFFLIAGIFGVFNFSLVVEEMRAASLPATHLLAIMTITTQLVGSVLLITNLQNLAWLGAGMLVVFTLLCIPLGHPFWVYAEPKRTHEMQIAFEHFALAGGLVLAAIASYRQ